MSQNQAELQMKKSLDKLIANAPLDKKDQLAKDLEGFRILFKRYLDEGSLEINWDDIKLVDEEVKRYSNLPEINADHIKEYLNKVVIIKLNGGLGTSMGCIGPKSLISVRSDLTFLDLTIQQIENLNNTYGCNIPLVLMNSFNTQEDTVQVINKYGSINVKIDTFTQSMYPRIHREYLLPITKGLHDSSEDGKHGHCIDKLESEAWYPPGHGDVYRSFFNSGLLDKYLDQGKKFVFISNIDNMGATVDLKILSFLLESLKTENSPEFVMEVTDKTRADIKGGTLIKYQNKLRLLEIAQVPNDRKEEFTSVRKFKIFNTNNLWVKLDAIKRVVLDGKLEMEVIINTKTLENGTNIIQLEEASGSAIKSFNHAIGVNVPRDRFLPVKQCADLLLIMSNLYELSKGSLVMSPKRSFSSVPLVKLGTHFIKVKDFLNRFSNIPDMLELDHLTVSGDVTFGKNVILKGTVIIVANHGERIDIPSGSILDNKIVSGNLRILDH